MDFIRLLAIAGVGLNDQKLEKSFVSIDFSWGNGGFDDDFRKYRCYQLDGVQREFTLRV